MDYSPPGSCVHKILQARILEGVAIPFSKRSSQPRDWTCVTYVSCMDRWVLYYWCHLGNIFGPTVYKCLGLPSVWRNCKYLFLVLTLQRSLRLCRDHLCPMPLVSIGAVRTESSFVREGMSRLNQEQGSFLSLSKSPGGRQVWVRNWDGPDSLWFVP